MVCAEGMELEKAWKRRYLATQVDGAGLFAVSPARSSHALMVRQAKAKLAQAANAILMHRKSCFMCGHASSAPQAQSLAS